MQTQIQEQLLLFLTLPLFSLFFHPSLSAGFNCTGTTSTKCEGLIGFKTTNSTTYASLSSLFQIPSLSSLYAANNLPSNTSSTAQVPANATVRIPFPCACANGTGLSDNTPVYTVKKDDGLYTIAVDIFGGFVTYQDVGRLNNIKNLDLIELGQKIWIPLPCSCDKVDGVEVVHYAHKVAAGSSLKGIAAEFGTTEKTLMELNGIEDAKDLLADSVLDVPLQACNSSSIRTESPDHGLLVPNGSYALTANDCIQCSCSSSKLMCTPANTNSSRTCPAATCSDASGGKVAVGDELEGTTTSTCCVYAGYNSTAIFTTITTCNSKVNEASPSPAPAAKSTAFLGRRRLGWVEIAILLLVTVIF